MSNIAILGGSKFIGPHLIEALHTAGHEITIFNRNKTNPKITYPIGSRIIIGDRNKVDDIMSLFSSYYDVVFDLSGFTPEHLEPIISDCTQNNST